jgi:hypothetical protein
MAHELLLMLRFVGERVLHRSRWFSVSATTTTGSQRDASDQHGAERAGASVGERILVHEICFKVPEAVVEYCQST